MSESFEDQLSRVQLMADPKSGTWDLSPKDCAALTAVLADREKRKAIVDGVDAFGASLENEKQRANELEFQNSDLHADVTRLIDTLERIASEWAVIDQGCSCETSVSSACPVCEISELLKEFVPEPEGATE